MNRYGGTLIHRMRDQVGLIEIVQEKQVLSLHFGTHAKQSSMDLNDPSRLVLSYTRAMLACLLFDPVPRSALLIGLGGGSLVRFLARHLPDCRVSALENRPAVATLARQFFRPPEDLDLVIADAAQYLRKARTCVDLLLVDAYDAQGLAPALFNPDFMANCRRILSPGGWISMNLWGDIEQPLTELAQHFSFFLCLPVRERGNLIALASPTPPDPARLAAARARAGHLGEQFGLEFPVFLEDMLEYRQYRSP